MLSEMLLVIREFRGSATDRSLTFEDFALVLWHCSDNDLQWGLSFLMFLKGDRSESVKTLMATFCPSH